MYVLRAHNNLSFKKKYSNIELEHTLTGPFNIPLTSLERQNLSFLET